jgi:hypothetical protein
MKMVIGKMVLLVAHNPVESQLFQLQKELLIKLAYNLGI